MKKLKFYKCEHCGNVVVKLIDKDVPVLCCGEIMTESVANSKEAATEKHLPVVKVENNIVEVKVGEVSHPMEENHYINFIAVETDKGYKLVSLYPGNEPKAKVYVGEEIVKTVYEYCNLHGLWKTEI